MLGAGLGLANFALATASLTSNRAAPLPRARLLPRAAGSVGGTAGEGGDFALAQKGGDANSPGLTQVGQAQLDIFFQKK